MGVSFKIARVGSRYRPSIPPPADPPESTDDDPEAPPLPGGRAADRERGSDTEVSFLGPDDNFGCFPICTTMNGKKSLETEHEASFSLNLYPNGFFIGKPTEGMLLPLLEDVPKLLHPYDRASKTLFTAIENGWLPGDILDDIPCKYYNGTLFVEVWDFRSCMLKLECTESRDEFPKVQKVCLRMGSENVIKDMQSISNASWTYNDLLQVESRIINFMHPKLYLSTKPSFDRLCNKPASKVDLGINKRELIKEWHDKPQIDSEPVPVDIWSCGGGVTVNLKPQEGGSPKYGTLSCAQNNMRTGPSIQQSNDLKSTTLCNIQITSQPCKASDVGCSVSITNTAAVVPSVLLPPKNDPKDSFLHAEYNATCGKRNQFHAESTCNAVKRAKRRLPVSGPPQKRDDSRPGLEVQNRVISQQPQEDQIRECVGIRDQRCPTDKFLTTKVLELEAQMASHQHRGQKIIVKEENIQAKVSCRPDVGKDKEESSLDVGNKKPKQLLVRRSQPREQCDNGLSIVKHTRENTSRKRKLTKSSQISPESSYQHEVSHFGKNQRTSLGTPGSTYPDIAATKDPAASVETASLTSPSNSSLIKESQIKDNKRVSFEASATSTCIRGTSKCSLTRIPPPPDLSDVNNVSALLERFSKIEVITQRYGLNIKKNKVDKYLTKKLSPSCLVPPVRFFVTEDSEETGQCRNSQKIRILTYKRVQFSFAENNLPFSASESWCKLVLSQPNELSDREVGAEIIYLTEERHFHVVFLPAPHYADLFAAQFTSLMENDGYQLVNDQLLDSSYATYDSSFGSSMHPGSSGFESLPMTTAEVGNPSRTPTLPIGVSTSSMHLHQCHQILPTRTSPSLNLTRPQRMASPDFNFRQQHVPMGFMSRAFTEMSLGAVPIPNRQGLVPLGPLQQCAHQPQGILQNKVASVRTSNDIIGGEARVPSAILKQISALNNPCLPPVLNRGMSPLLLNKPMMDLHNSISRRQHQLHLDCRKNFSAQQQQQQHNVPVIAQMRESTSVSSQQFLMAEGRQVVSGIANVGSPQLSSQTVGSAGSITNSPLDFVVMKEDNSSKDTL